MNRRSFVSGATALVAASRMSQAAMTPSRYLVLMGTRLNTAGKGIYASFFDVPAGMCTPVALAAEIAAPTAFALSATRKVLYSVSEVGNDGKSDGSVSAFAIDHRKGSLTLLNKVLSGGGGPTYLELDSAGKAILVGCYGSGRANAFRVLPDGRLGEQTGSVADYGTGPSPRQAAPHVHCTVFSPDDRFVLVGDLGADRIFIYRFDRITGKLTANEPPFFQAPAGTGPRHIAFHPNGKFVYLMSELVGRVTVFAWGAREGTLTEVQTISCFPDEATGDRSGAGLVIRPDGRYLYTTTRTDSSIEVYAIDPVKGTLVSGQHVASDGKLPWSCALDSTGSHLITTNQQSNSASIYGIDRATGNLTLRVSIPDVPSPVSAIFIPA